MHCQCPTPVATDYPGVPRSIEQNDHTERDRLRGGNPPPAIILPAASPLTQTTRTGRRNLLRSPVLNQAIRSGPVVFAGAQATRHPGATPDARAIPARLVHFEPPVRTVFLVFNPGYNVPVVKVLPWCAESTEFAGGVTGLLHLFLAEVAT